MTTNRRLEILLMALPLLEKGVTAENYKADYYICDTMRTLARFRGEHSGSITVEEMREMHNWLDSQMPTTKLHQKFYRHPLFNEGKRGREIETGWWVSSNGVSGKTNPTEGLKCQLQRIKFVKHLISLLKVELGIPLY